MNKKDFAKELLKSKIGCLGCHYGGVSTIGNGTYFCFHRWKKMPNNFVCKDWKDGTMKMALIYGRGKV